MENSSVNKYVIGIYQNGSMNKAAKAMGISQPALSMMISSLERKLGYVIFNRKTKPISLTPEGELYLDFLMKQTILLEDLNRKMSDLHGEKNEQVTIGGSVAYVESLIAPLVDKLTQKHPKCVMTIKSAPLQELIHETITGKMDCFISSSKEIPEHFTAIPLKKERIFLGIPKNWSVNEILKPYQVKLSESKAGFDEPEQIMDYSLLDGIPMISLMKNLPLQKKMDHFWEEYHVQPKEKMYVNQVSAAITFARRGIGMIAASEEALLNNGCEDFLCLYALPESVSDQTIYLVTDSDRYMPDIFRDVLSMLKERYTR